MKDKKIDIAPKEPNKTEDRMMNLIFNFFKYKNGLSFKKILKLMSGYYNNENIESDRKKFHRDIEELQRLQLPIKQHYPLYYEDDDPIVYWLDQNVLKKTVTFTDEELKYLSLVILTHYKDEASPELQTACQKIFSSKIELFPDIEYNSSKSNYSEDEEKIAILLQAITSKTPIKVLYSKNLPDEVEERFLEPYDILKKDSNNFYLFAFDREKKEKRKFLVPKIKKIFLTTESFISKISFSKEEKIVNALEFKKHNSVDLILEFDPNKLWKLKIFLKDYPYQIVENTIPLTTTNYYTLFDLMWKENGVITKVNNQQFLTDFKKYIDHLRSLYE